MSPITPDACAAALEAFIRESFQVEDNDPYFDRNVNLWDEGYVDSTGLVEVIAFLEETFGVTITDEMLFSPRLHQHRRHVEMIAELGAAQIGKPLETAL